MNVEQRVSSLVLEYAQAPSIAPVAATMSLRRDLSIDSLSLVSLVLRLGEELGVDLVERGIELRGLDTVGDLVALGHSLTEKGLSDG